MSNFRIMLLAGLIGAVAMSAVAQDAITVSFSNKWMDGPVMKLQPGPQTIKFTLSVATDQIMSCSNGFRLYYYDGTGSFGAPVGAWEPNSFFDPANEVVLTYSPGGSGADTIGFSGFGTEGGIPVGKHADLWTISGLSLSLGEVFCIDTAFFPSNGAWLWSTNGGDVVPDWYDAPYCLLVEDCPGIPAVFTNCPPVLMTFNHCATAVYDFDGLPGPCGGGNPITFSMVRGKGSIDPVTGVWSYSPTLADVGMAHTVEVRVADLYSGTSCSFEVFFTNTAPSIVCKGPMVAEVGAPFATTIEKDDIDCDTGTFSIVDVSPMPVGPYSLDPMSGVLAFTPDQQDELSSFDFEVVYSDGLLAATCVQRIVTFDYYACCYLRGDIDGSGTVPNVSDLTRFVNVFFKGIGPFLCDAEADVNDDLQRNVSDLTYLVSFLFRGGPEPVPCPSK